MLRSATGPWRIDAGDFPRDAHVDEQLRFLVGYAILAPSGHNTQPWRFRVHGGRVELYADRRRALPVVDPDDRELTMSCGAALEHLVLALRRFGWSASVETLPHGPHADLLARVALGGATEPGDADQALFAAIPHRRTNRAAYGHTPPPAGLLERCRDAAAAHHVTLTWTLDPAVRTRVAELVSSGDREQFADKRFRRELAAWIHSQRLGSRDGISGAGVGMPDVLSPVGSLVIRTFDIGNGVAAGDHEKVANGSPCLLALATARDDAEHWLGAGRALARVLLHLAAEGFSASYLNQPVEVESLRPRLREALSLAGSPQLLLRAGIGPTVEPAARRGVAEVLIGA